MTDVALVQMPYAMTNWPSLGLGLLKAGLRKLDIDSTVLYLNRWYSEEVGTVAYDYIASGSPANTDLLGEWTFCEALWGQNTERDTNYIRQVLEGQDNSHRKALSEEAISEARNHALKCRSRVEAFLRRCLRDVDWGHYKIVGFTSVFQQHISSLALARLLKERFPHILLIFGGANCEGDMGEAIINCFPFVDAVCRGEGDSVFPHFVESVLGGSPIRIDGILTRKTTTQNIRSGSLNIIQNCKEAAPILDLDSLPYPDFDDFFDYYKNGGPVDGLRLMFETSRGCWWGQKHHCTFCGLNGNGMTFRHKSSARAISELHWLLSRYGNYTRAINATDNIIPYQFFKSFLVELAQLDLKIDLFYETKANLRDDQLALYKQAGLSKIQPGIESLSSQVLTLMDKGVTALQNVQLLKVCKEFGIHPFWNYLYGFPGEKPEWYSQQGTLIKKLVHLNPPIGCARVRFDRFSPYLKNPARYGLTAVNPYPSYEYVYSGLPKKYLHALAYYFSGSFTDEDLISQYTADTVNAIKQWQMESHKSCLFYLEDRHATVVFDSRGGAKLRVLGLQGLHQKLLSLCARIVSRSEIERQMSSVGLGRVTTQRITIAIQELESRGLIISEDDKYLGVPVPLDSYSPVTSEVVAKFERLFAERTRCSYNDCSYVTLSQDDCEMLG